MRDAISISSGARPARSLVAKIALALLLAGCATDRRPTLYIFHGPDAVLAASARCGYAGAEKSHGSHIEPIVVLMIPNKPDHGFDCTWAWAKAHQGDGLTNQFPAG